MASKLLDGLEKLRGSEVVPNEKLGKAIGAAQEQVQLCQGVTPDMQASAKTLAERAIRGGVHGVAVRYGYLTAFQPPDEMRRPLLDAMLSDAQDGDMDAALQLGLSGDKLGLPRTVRCAYLLVANKNLVGAQRELFLASRQAECQYLGGDDRNAISNMAKEIENQRKMR